MKSLHPLAFSLLLGLAAATPLMLTAAPAQAASAEDLRHDGRQALDKLYRHNAVAADLAKHAKAILVFPRVLKAGLVFGGSYGEGVLFKAGEADGYYNTASASWGLQAGAQTYGYALFLMNDKAQDYLSRSDGWEIGAGPTVVVVNEGVAASLSSTTLTGDAYAFAFDQQGLMAGLSIEGSKISRIQR